MKRKAAALAALLLVCCVADCGSKHHQNAGSAETGTSPVYIAAFQSDDHGVEAEGGRGWVELKVSDASKLSGEWSVYTAYGAEWKSPLCVSTEIAAFAWHLETGSIIRLHPQTGYTGTDDSQSAGCGNDGKYDLCYDDVMPGHYAPNALCGAVWVEDGTGAVTDFAAFLNGSDTKCFLRDLIDGTPSDGTRTLSDAVASGQWSSDPSVFVFDAGAGYARLADESKDGNLPSDWMLTSDPSIIYSPEFYLHELTALPSPVAKGTDIVCSLSASGIHGAEIDSVTFDFSAVAFSFADSSDGSPHIVPRQSDGIYSCVLHTRNIIPGSYSVVATVSGKGAVPVQRNVTIMVVEKPVVTISDPVFSFTPSTTVAIGREFTVSVTAAATATTVSGAVLRCTSCSFQSETLPDASGQCVWTLSPSMFPEGDYLLECVVKGEGAEDAMKTVPLSVRSNAVVPGGDMETAIQSGTLNPSPATGYVDAVSSPGNVHSGNRSLHISGSAASNGFVFSTPVACASKEGFSRLVLYLKGEAHGKSLSFNIFTDSTHYRIFNLGNILDDAVISPSGSNSYSGSISAADWVKISLDLSDVIPAGKIACKFGASGVYDLYLDDISYE